MTAWQDPEALLERFRHWLGEAREEAETHSSAPTDRDDGFSSGGAALTDVVAALTALRQEVKLETKSTRGVKENIERALGELGQAVSRFDSVQANEEQAARGASEPLAQALADLDEAIERGRLAVEQSRRKAFEELHSHGPAALDMQYYSQWFWQRWKCRAFYFTIRHKWLEELLQSQHEIWEGLEQGYRLVQNRLRRLMDAHGIKRLDTVGQAVDPHTMIVVELVAASKHPPGSVAQEVRPGYLWKGKTLRLAEVRAVRPNPGPLSSVSVSGIR